VKKITINIVSESAFTVQGHGVHSAFTDMVDSYKTNKIFSIVSVNSWKRHDINHYHTVGLYSLFHMLFVPGKSVMSVHVVPDSLVGSFILAKYWKWIATGYLHFVYARADTLVAVSPLVETYLYEHNFRNKIEYVPNSINLAKYSTVKKSTTVNKRPMIVSSGQVQPRKRFDLFVDWAKQRPEYDFLWIGGINFKSIASNRREMNLLIADAPKNLTVTGVIEREKVIKMLADADVFVMPSEQENHPVSVLEAAAIGLPIILRDIPAYEKTFPELPSAKSDDDFLPLVDKVLKDNDFQAEATKKSKIIANRFDTEKSTKKLISIYKDILA
jgi:1,2-diacylglycerol-3-alpha-glucose alpha-1,2-galactosyltransferase